MPVLSEELIDHLGKTLIGEGWSQEESDEEAGLAARLGGLRSILEELTKE